MTQNLRMSVEQAAQAVLAKYLQAELDPQFGGGAERCVVNDRWAEPDSGLPKRSISIIPAGPREDTNLQEQEVSRIDIPAPSHQSIFTYRMSACRQPIQLDVWATASATRDDLCARLEDSLRKGERHTLGTFNGNAVRDGVLLALDPKNGGFEGFADFTFDGPMKTDTSRSVREREYRATIMGAIEVDMTVKAATPRLARAFVAMALNPAPAPVGAPFVPDLTIQLDISPDGDQPLAVTGT